MKTNPNPVLAAIQENLQNFSIIFRPTDDAFRESDKKHTGDSKEITIQEFIKSYFPKTYTVRKGPIYSKESFSQEQDCVILTPNHPPMITPIREINLVEGVHAAIEVKPDIAVLTKKSEFHRALVQSQSVKRLERQLPVLLQDVTKIPKDYHKIPTVIFSQKSRSLTEMVEYMLNCVQEGDFLPGELPDAIVTLDNGILFHTPIANYSIFSQLIASQPFVPLNYSGEVFMLIEDLQNVLAIFLLILYSFPSPEIDITEPILKKYLSSLNVLIKYILPNTIGKIPS